MPPLMFALLAAAGVAGIMLIVAGAVGTRPAPARPDGRLQRARRYWRGANLSRRDRLTRQIILVAAAAITVLVWLLVKIPLLALLAGLIVLGVRWLFGAGAGEQRAIAQLEALESWTRRLSDVVRTGLGLGEAILVSTRDAPQALAEDLQLLAAHLRGGVTIVTALDRLADRLSDATSDEVIVALRLHATDRGQRLSDILDELTASVAREITVRREVWASRADPRLTTKIMTCLGIGTYVLLVTNPTYIRPYATLMGQAVIAVCTGVFLALLIWIRKLSTTRKAPRLLSTQESR
ncbi:type II secretion system protein [Actinoplanes sp. SE50]|uniref:type II secretion system F family protein n=1 Tax=unclassified Actinoplanes TaxID=2626549 RepID=UPI00023ED676|nr:MULTISPECIES: type II secretion system F family protein [unclassified Actinoplanes]AEV86779.1 type II secretion system protein [Actinoplanes sp. SE50/110]ATO85176.1 type II secretion system protein [Actinoplanes sp. SE50]SLM02586.1 type II secretion system protein [Actinoplanes sp. SE50/110]